MCEAVPQESGIKNKSLKMSICMTFKELNINEELKDCPEAVYSKSFNELALSCVYLVFALYVRGVLRRKVFCVVCISLNLFAFLSSQAYSQGSRSWIHLHRLNSARAPAPFTQSVNAEPN